MDMMGMKYNTFNGQMRGPSNYIKTHQAYR